MSTLTPGWTAPIPRSRGGPARDASDPAGPWVGGKDPIAAVNDAAKEANDLLQDYNGCVE